MINLSATSIGCFKACPTRYYDRYVLGLVPVEDTDSQRVGTNYHRIHEIADMEPGGVCECQKAGYGDRYCTLCEGTGRFPDDPMDAVIRHLNDAYKEPPINKTVEEWEVERIILLYSLIGYKWWYDEGPGPNGYENLSTYKVERLEQKFDLPLKSPITGHPLRANLRGKIDRVFAAGNNRFVHEYKSTSKSIDPDSTYWGHLTLDTQTRLYTYAARELGLGMCGVLYDVWHKPTIKPKKLTQAESQRFSESGEYCGEKFEVEEIPGDAGTINALKVNGKTTEYEYGKKEGTFAIRETPEMFGARLLQDITTRPEFYFARREIVHTAQDIEAFQYELMNIYQSIRSMSKHNRFFKNEHQCEATFKCSYIDFCYNNINLGPDDVPDNFKKLGGK
jgi:hypothetical protein